MTELIEIYRAWDIDEDEDEKEFTEILIQGPSHESKNMIFHHLTVGVLGLRWFLVSLAYLV